MSETDTGERTEKAPDQKVREARRKGKLSRSQDLTAWVGIAAAGALAATALNAGKEAATGQVLRIQSFIRNPDAGAAIDYLGDAIRSVGDTLGVLLAGVVVAVVAGAALQGGIHLRPPQLKADHLNPVNGLKRIFGKQSLWEGLKALLKTVVIGGAVAIVVVGIMPTLQASGGESLSLILSEATSAIMTVLWVSVAVGIALAIVDAMVVRRRNRQHTMMTKKEAKDEHKRTEGDPLIRSQRRSRQMAMSRNRMIAAVADSDVVLVNPTHIAVALKYEPGKSAPRVVAKGQEFVAERIREKAREASVPLVKDVPLARALYAGTDIGREIPTDLFGDVAKVLVFVAALKRRGGGGSAIHTVPPRR